MREVSTTTLGDELLEQYARTRHFQLGEPRQVALSPGGERICFLRSESGSSPVQSLYILDAESGEERLIADARQLAGGSGLSHACATELARRERVREHATGIVAFDTSWEAGLAVFALDDRLFLADLEGGGCRALEVEGPVFDPRLAPSGDLLAYVGDGSLRLVPTQPGGRARMLLEGDPPRRTWGLAEFVAAEEMGRTRGFWWSPFGDELLVAHVDNEGVTSHHLGDLAHPDRPVPPSYYPFAGTRNAAVRLYLVSLDGAARPLEWDFDGFEYLVSVSFDEQALLLYVESRDQRRAQVLAVDPRTVVVRVRAQIEAEPWVHLTPGVPALTGNGSLVMTTDLDETRHLCVDGTAVTPTGLQVRAVLGVEGDHVLFGASRVATEIHVFDWSPSGLEQLTSEEGVHSAQRRAGTTVTVSRGLQRPGSTTVVTRAGRRVELASRAERPVVLPEVRLARVGADELSVAVLRPDGRAPDSGFPVLLDPYGGPSTQRVLASLDNFLLSAWWVMQGFAVIVADGHGTPGRGLAWERSIEGDTLSLPLADQVAALQAVAARDGDLDLTRVAMRGWSFGGFMAAAAVLRYPEVFAAAVDGAGDVDARLYDTHFKERYLGHPLVSPERYDRCSLVSEAHGLSRPLLVMHGLADDNVLVGHSIRFVHELVRHARPHSLALLPGVTHMVADPAMIRGRLALELDFLRRALRMS